MDHHADVAVGQVVDPVVVGHEDRCPDPGTTSGQGRRHETVHRPGDPPGPLVEPERPTADGGQHLDTAGRLQRRGPRSGQGRLHHLTGRPAHQHLERRQPGAVIRPHPVHRRVPGGQPVEHRVDVAVPDGQGQLGGGRTGVEPVAAPQLGDGARQRAGGSAPVLVERTDQVPHDGAGLDAGELERVAHQDHACRRTHGVEEAGQQRQRNHRRLVDHHEVVHERIRAVMAERRPRPVLQQAVDRGRGDGAHAVGHPGTQAAGRVEGDHLLLHRLGHPGGGLAGGGGERHLERGAALVGHLEGGGQDPGDGVRLARTGTSGDHRQRTGEGALRRHELEVDRTVLVERHAAEHFGKAPSDDRGLTRVGRAYGGAPVGPPTHVAGDGHLEAPESLQVDAIAVEHERPERVVPVRRRARPGIGHHGGSGQLSAPGPGIGQAQTGRPPGVDLGGDELVVGRCEVQADVAEARGPRRQRQGEQDGGVGSIGCEAEHGGHQVHLEVAQHPRVDPGGEYGVRRLRGPPRRTPGHDRHRAAPIGAPSRTALASSRRPGANSQVKTPWGSGPSRPTPGPVIPRTNR